MSLLPIIYSSLLIFAAVMTVILIVSYISYKAKSRNSIPDNSIYENIPVPAPVVASNRGNYTYSQPVRNTAPATYTQPVSTVYRETRSNTGNYYTQDYSAQRKPTRETTSRKRFEVINNSSRNDFLPSLKNNSFGGYSSAPAPEFNFLNYYSDRKEDNLSSITVDRYRNIR